MHQPATLDTIPCPASEAAADAGRIAARNALVMANLPLVMFLAGRLAGRGVETGDLVGLGALALTRASEGFDPDLGKFSAYAGVAIRRAMGGAIRRARVDEAAVGDEPAGAADVPDPAVVEPLEALTLAERREQVRAAVARLPAKHRAVIALRHDLDGGGERTGHAVAAQLGVSRQRVHQIEAVALDRLRGMLGRHEGAS